MMSIKKTSNTSVLTADTPVGQQSIAIFRARYNKRLLSPERGKFLNQNRLFPVALDRLIDEYSMPVVAPEGGRIHVVRVPVNPGREWQEAINAAGPNTGADWDVRKVGDQYPAQRGKTKVREIILVNFGRSISDGQFALDWAKSRHLRPTDPRKVLATGEHKPKLHEELGLKVMAVVSLKECSFGGFRHVVHAWWGESERDADLSWFGRGFRDYCWFAFEQE